MTTPLRIPAVLAFTVLGIAVATAAGSCDRGSKTTVDAKYCVYCVYDNVDNGNCPFPTCVSGSGSGCPEGCSVMPPV